MKNAVKYILQKVLGYQRYLYVFAKYKIRNLENDKKEGDFFAFLNEIESKGDLLDVGANIGIMTYHLSKKFPDRAVIAIEPLPSNYTILNKIINKYTLKNVEVLTVAVGEADGEDVKMVLPQKGNVKMQGLAHVVHDSITEWNEGDHFKVKSERLDSLMQGRKIAGIKMDIENFEYFGLLGAKGILEKDKPVIYLELWENENRTNCMEYLQNLGYETWVNSSDGLERYNPDQHNCQNFIFK